MGLRAVLESLDGVPEELHGFYKEHDGKFVLEIDGFDEHPSVGGLKRGHANAKRERDEVRQKLTEAEERLSAIPEDFSLEDYERMKADAAAREDDPDGKDVRRQIEAAVNAARQQEQQKSAAETKKLNTRIEALESDNQAYIDRHRGTVIERHLDEAADAASVKPGLRKAFKAMLRSDVDYVEEDGEEAVRMKSNLGGDGVVQYAKDFMASEEGKHFIESAKGGDAPGGGQQRQPGNKKAGDMGGNRADRTAAIASKFPDLPAQ